MKTIYAILRKIKRLRQQLIKVGQNKYCCNCEKKLKLHEWVECDDCAIWFQKEIEEEILYDYYMED